MRLRALSRATATAAWRILQGCSRYLNCFSCSSLQPARLSPKSAVAPVSASFSPVARCQHRRTTAMTSCAPPGAGQTWHACNTLSLCSGPQCARSLRLTHLRQNCHPWLIFSGPIAKPLYAASCDRGQALLSCPRQLPSKTKDAKPPFFGRRVRPLRQEPPAADTVAARLPETLVS